ncbi:GntR family transcriptional regulator [Amycolatopsis endophytica]|uniref:DNA-binding GntR family transcriptional regulator n=1 Tax=Amycolatopsis endophytica TaxID=860233 RepID=A0A853BA72_9PSEU|nr:GntR family transcriptional regulator [Amycolatopsis endophytica]NYI91674.1 DNA-binding GntR family transcriptional regulator [Amycolatopsis endophytica]
MDIIVIQFAAEVPARLVAACPVRITLNAPQDGETVTGQRSTRERLTDEVRAAITGGRLQPGARLNERELCERHGVSRTALRETLRKLEGEGLVAVEPNRGAFVARITYQDAEALFELRGALEALACSLFARRGTPEQKRALVESLHLTAATMRAGGIDETLAAKDRFYGALLDGAGNPELTSSLRRLHARIQLLRRHSLAVPGRTEQSIRELEAMCEAIVAGDAEGARLAGSRHVAQAGFAALPRIFAEEASTAGPGPAGEDFLRVRTGPGTC